jgi:hypothetical protein
MGKKFKSTVKTQNNITQKTTSRTARRGMLPLTAQNNKDWNTFYSGTTMSGILLSAEQQKA